MTLGNPPENAEQQRINLAKAFPSISILQVDAVLLQLRDILAQVTLAIELILLFVLAAGISVLIAGLHSSLSKRVQQGALIRALGALRKLLITAVGMLGTRQVLQSNPLQLLRDE